MVEMEKMRKLMCNDAFYAGNGRFREVCIEGQNRIFPRATSPSGFHFSEFYLRIGNFLRAEVVVVRFHAYFGNNLFAQAKI